MSQGNDRSAGTFDAGTALITGASSGIGAEFARQLASRGYDLILVARRLARLEQLGAELAERHAIRTEILAADLVDPVGLGCVEDRIAGLTDLTLVINNAGFGTAGALVSVPLDRQMQMIALHVTVPVRLCLAALPGMIARSHGAVINVASMAAFIPLPGSTLYGATKAAMVSFSEALQFELRGSGVRVQALCPGLTRTELHTHVEMQGYSIVRRPIPSFLWSSPEDVVAASLKSLDSQFFGRQEPISSHVVCIPSLKNRAIVTLAHLGVVSWLVRRLALPAP
jgi:short-subunit dehydrogenase